MLMRDDYRVESGDRFSDGFQPFADLFPAQPGINEDARVAISDEQGVPGTAAGENAEFDDDPPPASG
jgi:hypothetical protein